MPLEILDHKANLMILLHKSTKWSIITMLHRSFFLALLATFGFVFIGYVIEPGTSPTVYLMAFGGFFIVLFGVFYGLMYVINLNNTPNQYFVFDKGQNTFMSKQHYLDDRGKVTEQYPLNSIQRARIRVLEYSDALSLELKDEVFADIYSGSMQDMKNDVLVINNFLNRSN